MVNSALCFGLNYPGTEDALQGCDLDAGTMTGVAANMGIENVQTVTDDAGPVTREQILEGLREMVAQAQPGDSLLFSFAGHGGQTADLNGDEQDGQDEVIWASDGPVTDDEIRAILAELPEGANMTMVYDSCASGTIADLDLSDTDIPGNVVVMSATAPNQESLGGADGGRFTNALADVIANNPGVSWADAAVLVDQADGNHGQSANVSANRPELLYEPAFGPVGEMSRDMPTDAAAIGSALATEDRDGDGYAERSVETFEDGTVVERIDLDGDGITDVTAVHLSDGTTYIEHDANGDGVADTIATFAADGTVTYVATDAPAYSGGAEGADGYMETRLETHLDGTQVISVDYDGDLVLDTVADANNDGLIDGAMDVNLDGTSDLTYAQDLAADVSELAAIADIDIGGDICC
ncbi:Ca(2+)-dependent cysteine protease [Blastocladiella emersonii ATCC 22665]|nr:Ca(2+)-dependent cysteine protease [Blastocladiella emersonii ATCC 22665]